ncbi:CAP domain-containing protein [Marinifilum flexuosum]|uniref:Cysteine-rich secretory protein family protein n=1 Tax=Marinifilum flexuosum TaxID=1117708 RepID=A0A419WTD5_9BACT|nr:CAP domain-containing protein [Marinifilum flexuosum]RKD98676.1 Cysteine-rich secretory protein family protein [Marinifilum flexuosum]
MRNLLCVGIATILLVLSACRSDETVIIEEEIISQPLKIDAQVLLNLVNDARAEGRTCGDTYYPPVDAVLWNVKLEEAAINHSADMYENDFFSHESPKGSTLSTRLQEVEYNYSTAGENIAYGYTSEQQVIEIWLKSQGHCANIMNGNFKEMGLGRVGNYWTQNFGTQR